MYISTKENVIIANNEKIENIKNTASYRKIKNYYAGLGAVTKSSCNILGKIKDNEKEKRPQKENYDFEVSKNDTSGKNQFDKFKNNVGQNYINTNNSNCSKNQEKGDSIRKLTKENIFIRRGSIISNISDHLEINNNKPVLNDKNKFLEFQLKKSLKRNSMYIPNDERKRILVKMLNLI